MSHQRSRATYGDDVHCEFFSCYCASLYQPPAWPYIDLLPAPVLPWDDNLLAGWFLVPHISCPATCHKAKPGCDLAPLILPTLNRLELFSCQIPVIHCFFLLPNLLRSMIESLKLINCVASK